MSRIFIENRKERKWLREKYHTAKAPYISKALAFQLNTDLAISIRRDALQLKTAQLIEN